MPTAKIVDIDGQAVGEQDLAESIFGMPVHMAVLHQVVTAQLVNRRQGNASTLTRKEVSGGNHKPYRQKGTGHARQGSTRAPHFRHGGTVFGPHPHPYHHKVQRNMRRIAIRSALSDKAGNERIYILQDFALDEPKTKKMVSFFTALELTDEVHAHPSTLILLAERDENIIRSMRNIPYVKVGHVSSINVVELLKHDYLMLTPEALTFIEETFDDGLPAALEADDEEA
jgi:large subunit ribosomal protein L4